MGHLLRKRQVIRAGRGAAGALVCGLVQVLCVLSVLIPGSASGQPAPSAIAIRGRVRDLLSGAGIARARVVVQEVESWPEGDLEWPELVRVTADANGDYALAIPGAAEPRVVRIQAEADGHGVGYVQARVRTQEPAVAPIDFALPPGVSFGGHVLDAEGRPVARAELVLHRSLADWRNESWEFHCPSRQQRAEADAHGEFRFAGVDAGAYTLTIRSGGRGGGAADLTVVGEETVEVRLWPPREVRTRVVDKESGRPLAGKRAVVGGRVVTSGVDGLLQMSDLRPGQFVIRAGDVRGDGFLWSGEDLPAELRWDRPAGDLRPACGYSLRTIRGRIVTGHGRPATGASAGALIGWSGDGVDLCGDRCFGLRVDPHLDGSFEAPLWIHEDFGPWLAVFADHTTLGWGRSPLHELCELEEGDEVIVQLVPGGHVSGTVVDPGGRPIAGARVGAHRTKRLVLVGAGPLWPCGAAPIEVMTDRNGRFCLQHVPLGSIEISVAAPGYCGGCLRWLYLAAGETVREMELRPVPYRTIRGRVLDDQGHAVTVELSATSEIGPEWRGSTWSRADGSFAFKDLPPLVRTIGIQVRDGDDRFPFPDLPVGDAALELKLPR